MDAPIHHLYTLVTNLAEKGITVKHVRQSLLAGLCGLLLLIALQGCEGGSSGAQGGNGGGGAEALPTTANAAFNGTFRGDLTTTQGGQNVVDVVTVTMTVGSPLRGTFNTSISSGTIAGEATGNAATFTGTFDFNGDCRGTITNGSATLMDDNTISFSTSGSDCNGQFTSRGTLMRVANTAPIANAGAEHSVTTGMLVTLDGRDSSDANGDRLTFAWSFVSVPTGSTVTLANPTTVNPTLTPDVAGMYVVQLVVNDGRVDSAPDTVIVTAAATNAAPVANAGTDQSVIIGMLVTLGGQSSSDANGDRLTFAWSFVSVPTGSAATLANPATVNPTFTPDVAGMYVVQLVVNDGRVGSIPDTVTITASTANAAPMANAGPDQDITTGTLVTLDGSGSSDANGDQLTFAWAFVSVPAGSTATLTNPTAVNPTFTADVVGSYVVRLMVNDGQVSSAEARVTIAATTTPPPGNQPPAFPQPTNTRVATQNQFNDLGQLIGAVTSLEILTPAVDPDGDLLTYAWTATNGSIISNGGPTATWTRVIQFGQPASGTVRATVTDGRGGMAIFTFIFN